MPQPSRKSNSGKRRMELAKHMHKPHHPIQLSGAPAEPSKSTPHMCLIPSSLGDLLAAAAPNKRICRGMAWVAHFSLGAHPGATKYK